MIKKFSFLFYSIILFSFPLLRIVKKRAPDLKNYGDLRVFDCHGTLFDKSS
jgi:hypothetical protein